MMINKRLIKMAGTSKKYVVYNVLIQWVNLLANIVMMVQLSALLYKLYAKNLVTRDMQLAILVFGFMLAVRFICEKLAVKMSYLASHTVKKVLRESIYNKLLHLGRAYQQKVSSAEVVQVAVEGVEQLETYFGAYLPQFFFSLLAPLTLFVVLAKVNIISAAALLICVPLIPITIAVIQTWAKKLLAKYWGQYTALGDRFLENLQGLTTLKIYQTDQSRHEMMNREAEQFRKITMKVLSMQLSSITVMDVVTYGGAALGIFLAVSQLQRGRITLDGCILIILLSADYFIPMRRLGSSFHVAMNGMAACDKIFKLLDLPEEEEKKNIIGRDKNISIQKLSYAYEKEREILKGITLDIPTGKLIAIVGESGCGKSTIAGILSGKNKHYKGRITIGGIELESIQEKSLMENLTLVSHNSYLFKGSVRDNLLLAKPDATDMECRQVLQRVKIYDFFEAAEGLDTCLKEKASNLSGGQCQRLALARALLHDSPIYIFDEASSNVDAESEEAIMEQIYALAGEKTVIMISHRLSNVIMADQILVMEKGNIAEQGTHRELMERKGLYAHMFLAQQELEFYGRGERS